METFEATDNHLDPKEMLTSQESNHPETTLDGKSSASFGEASDNTTSLLQRDGLKFLIPSIVGSVTVGSSTDQKVNVAPQNKSSGLCYDYEQLYNVGKLM